MFYFMGQMRPKTKGAYPGPGMNEMVYNLVYSHIVAPFCASLSKSSTFVAELRQKSAFH